jgi:hypothetical protein
VVSMSCLFYRQERTHTVSDFIEYRFNKFGQLGWGGRFMGDTDFAFLHSHWKFLDATVFKTNSCEKFKAKISEKSEKKRSEYLKRTSETHVKRISVRLLFALKRKIFLSETGSP